MSLSGYRGKYVKVKTAKKRKISSTNWLKRHLNDPFVAKSKIDGYKSRAAYKLIEINDKFKLLKNGMNVVDLGAAPGGWSQISAKMIKSDISSSENKLIAIDILPMEPIAGVTSIQKDFYDKDIKDVVFNEINSKYVDIVLSDMASNTTGHSKTDHLRILDLCENALSFALEILKPGGHFVCKIFKGGAEIELLNLVKSNFKFVKHFKPNSSRKKSSEFYLVAMNRK